MQSEVIIVGAGEAGRIVLDVCQELGDDVVGFLDDTKAEGERINGTPVLGGTSLAWQSPYRESAEFHVAIGDPHHRVTLSERLITSGCTLRNILHPSCIILPSAKIGRGVYMGPFCYVATNASIGSYIFFGARVTISGDVTINDGVWVGPSCCILRGSYVGPETFVGTSATVIPDKKFGSDCIIGAGSVVINDIPDGATAVGSPARVIKKREKISPRL